MSVYLAPLSTFLQLLSETGVPLSGGLLWTYAAGTTTPVATWTDSTGVTANSNPIQMASDGRLPNVTVWVTGGAAIKFVFSTNSGTTGSPAFGTQLGPTFDQVWGINDPTALLAELANPTYGASLVANAVIGYQAFANLRAAGVPSIVAGQALLIQVEGGDAIGDNKAGTFYWSPTATGTDDDNNTIAPTGAGASGRYLRLPTAGLPTLVNALAGLSMVSGGLIYGEGTGTLGVLDPGADGSSLQLSGGLPVWTAGSGGTGVGTFQLMTVASGIYCGSVRTVVFQSYPVVPGTFWFYAELDAAISGSPSLNTIMASDQSGTLTQVGVPLGWCLQETSGAYQPVRYNAAYPGCTAQALYNAVTNHLELKGAFVVPAGTTSVSFYVWCNGGSAPSITVAAGSFGQLLRLA